MGTAGENAGDLLTGGAAALRGQQFLKALAQLRPVGLVEDSPGRIPKARQARPSREVFDEPMCIFKSEVHGHLSARAYFAPAARGWRLSSATGFRFVFEKDAYMSDVIVSQTGIFPLLRIFRAPEAG
jgi:hypothetical protein